MTTEEKARAYDEALTAAKKRYVENPSDGYVGYANEVLKELFPELAKNKEERIKEELINFLRNYFYEEYQEIDLEKIGAWINWLEGQKEGNVPGEEELSRLRESCFDAGMSVVIENPEHYGLQKSVKWSAEDEKMRNSILDKMISLDNAYGGDGIAYGSEIAWLKSLRPSWKPSEEQMEALAMAVTFFKTKWTGAKVKEQLALESLYEDLNKRI